MVGAFIPMLICFLFSHKALLGLGQDSAVCDEAYIYIMFMAPSILLIGLGDLQRKFMIQSGHSDLQMKS